VIYIAPKSQKRIRAHITPATNSHAAPVYIPQPNYSSIDFTMSRTVKPRPHWRQFVAGNGDYIASVDKALSPVHTVDYSRRIRRLSPQKETVAEFSDSHRKRRLAPNSETVTENGDCHQKRRLSPKTEIVSK